MSMTSTTEEYSSAIEIDVGHEICSIIFTASDDYLVSGGSDRVCVWEVQNGKRRAAMEIPAKSGKVTCVAVSKDRRWIAAGTWAGHMFLWGTETYEQVFAHEENGYSINGVDFSPSSTHLVASWGHTATVWDNTAHRVRASLRHDDKLIAAKYSSLGDRIATATPKSVRVWDSNDGRTLLDIEVPVMSGRNTGLLWANDYLFVISDGKIKQIDASSGSAISEWPITNNASQIVMSHKTLITYVANDNIMLWDTSAHVQLHFVQPPKDIRSIAYSPDGRLLAIANGKGRVIVEPLLSHLTHLTPLSRLHPTFQDPEIRIEDAALHLWKHDKLGDAEALLTATISRSQSASHHAFASRALIRSRLQQWDTAIVDAEQSIKIRPSMIGYIANSIALASQGKTAEACRACDIAFEHFHSTHVTIILLIKAVVLFMAGEHNDAILRIDHLIATVFFNSTFYVVQAYMHFFLGTSRMESGDYKRAIQSMEHARAQLGNRTSPPPLVVSLISGWKFDNLGITIQQRLCEALYASGRAQEAGDALLETINTFRDELRAGEAITEWVIGFMQRCLSTPEKNSETGTAARHDNAPVLQGSLRSSSPTPLLREWARIILITDSWNVALASATAFIPPKFVIYRTLCESLETVGRVTDAVACFHQMDNELALERADERMNWILDFESRCRRRLEDLGDTAMNAHQYGEAISKYTIALSLHPTTPQNIFVKRSEAHLSEGLWEDALNDANEAIKLDPSFPVGYERMHGALRVAGHYGDAVDAFETMVTKMSQSSDPATREFSHRYVRPAQVKETIRAAIMNTIRDSPLVLIHTTSGRLYNKLERASAFESMPAFTELVSSMTTHIHHAHIEDVVGEYYRYAMFSHKWEDNEPLFEKVTKVVVYDLEEFPTHEKLKMFCKIVREAGFNWAWSDTCCINKGDHFVLQESLVSMFRWYQGSSMTVIFLRGVHPLARRGALTKSIWNTRAWTLQEYHASKVVQFYTEDWTPYLNLDIYNHKESPEIISEMEEATDISAAALMTLQPGLDYVREKLRLASTRQTTRVEDAAYSLLGIFSLSLPIVYGDGDRALGKFLALLLASSGDTSILAWTGRSGSFNSCLPADIAVFDRSPASHIPSAIIDAEMVTTTAALRASSLNLILVTRLYDRLGELPVPLFAGHRIKIPCLTFKLGRVSTTRNGSEYVFRAQTAALGVVEIRTEENLSQLESLSLIHPWIDFLLARHPVGSRTETIPEGSTADPLSPVGELPTDPDPFDITSTALQTRAAWLVSRFGRRLTTSTGDAPSLRPPSTVAPMEKQKRVLQFVARLRRPFGALLLTPTRQRMDEYRRVAAQSLITVQVEEITPMVLDKLISGARTLDVL